MRRQGYSLGIVTNGSTESQRAKLDSTGLAALVDTVLVSAEEKVKKPDVEIFVRAAERLGTEPKACVFVGDNPQADIGGARSAGMKTVWVKKGRTWPEELCFVPNYVVSQLTELLTIEF